MRLYGINLGSKCPYICLLWCVACFVLNPRISRLLKWQPCHFPLMVIWLFWKNIWKYCNTFFRMSVLHYTWYKCDDLSENYWNELMWQLFNRLLIKNIIKFWIELLFKNNYHYQIESANLMCYPELPKVTLYWVLLIKLVQKTCTKPWFDSWVIRQSP